MTARIFVSLTEVADLLGYHTTRAFQAERPTLEEQQGFPPPFRGGNGRPFWWRREEVIAWRAAMLLETVEREYFGAARATAAAAILRLAREPLGVDAATRALLDGIGAQARVSDPAERAAVSAELRAMAKTR